MELQDQFSFGKKGSGNPKSLDEVRERLAHNATIILAQGHKMVVEKKEGSEIERLTFTSVLIRFTEYRVYSVAKDS